MTIPFGRRVNGVMPISGLKVRNYVGPMLWRSSIELQSARLEPSVLIGHAPMRCEKCGSDHAAAIVKLLGGLYVQLCVICLRNWDDHLRKQEPFGQYSDTESALQLEPTKELQVTKSSYLIAIRRLSVRWLHA